MQGLLQMTRGACPKSDSVRDRKAARFEVRVVSRARLVGGDALAREYVSTCSEGAIACAGVMQFLQDRSCCTAKQPKAEHHSRTQTHAHYSFIATSSPVCTADSATRSKRDIELAHTPALPRHKEHANSASARRTQAALERRKLLLLLPPRHRAPTAGAARPPRDVLSFLPRSGESRSRQRLRIWLRTPPLPRSRYWCRLAVGSARTHRVRRRLRVHDDRVERQKPSIRHRDKDDALSQAGRNCRRANSQIGRAHV